MTKTPSERRPPAESHLLVTIGVTCFNAEDTIAAAVKSACAQDWPRVEILVVDDASGDRSPEIVASLAEADSRIRVIRHERNRGYAAALNTIVAEAKGEFVAIFDDDDVSVPERITRQWQRLIAYEESAGTRRVLCYSNRNVQAPDGTPDGTVKAIGRKAPEPHGVDVADFLLWHRQDPAFVWGQFGSCTLFARRQTLIEAGGFDEEFRRSAEWDFAIRLALMGGHFIAVNDSLVTMRKTPTADKAGGIVLENALRLRHKHRDYLRSHHLYRASLAMARARFHYARGERLKSGLHVALASLYSPAVLRSQIEQKRRNTAPAMAAMTRNSGYLLALRVVQGLLRMSVLYFVVRALSSAQFGQYQFVLSCAALLRISTLPGLNSAVMQSTARGFPGTFRRTIPRALLGSVAGSMVLLALGLYYRAKGAPELTGGFVAAAALFPLAYGLEQWKSVFAGREDFAGLLKVESVGFMILALCMIVAVRLEPGAVIVPLLAMLAALSAWNLLLSVRTLRRIPRDAPVEAGSLGYGVRLTAYSLLNVIAGQVDKILIFSFLSPEALAIFIAAERIPELTKGALQDIASVLAPRFAKRAAYTQDLDTRLHRAGMFAAGAMIIIAFTFIPWVLPWLIRTVFGDNYSASIPYAQALMCSIAIASATVLRYRYVASKLDASAQRTINLAISATRVVASLALVPFLGIVGAVISAFIYRIATATVVYFVVKRRYLTEQTPAR